MAGRGAPVWSRQPRASAAHPMPQSTPALVLCVRPSTILLCTSSVVSLKSPLVFLPFGVVLGQKYLEGGKPRLVCSSGFRGEASAVSKFTILEFGLPQICLAFSNI